jgi:hypothetical protein
MSSAKVLHVRSAFGRSLQETYLLAAHPDEDLDAQGRPLRDARTLVLKLQGNRAVYQEQLPLRLGSSWYSSTGVAYCGAIDSKVIYKYAAGAWTEEQFSDKPVDFVSYIFAVPGESAAGDTVFLATPKQIFIRQGGKWLSKRAPGEGFPFQMDGTRGDQVYIGGPELSMWDGKKLVSLDAPEDDGLGSLVLSADDRLVGGSTYISISTESGGWERIAAPVKRFFMFARFREEVYALSGMKGVLRVYPGKPTVVTPPMEAYWLASVGDGLVAVGEDVVFAYDGTRWFEVDIPKCELGKVPEV